MPEHYGNYFRGPKGHMDRDCIIIVEGIDDAYFVDALLTNLNAPRDRVGIIYIRGKTNLKMDLADFTKSRQFVAGTIKSYAFIGDADADPAGSLADVHAALAANAQPCPPHGGFLVGTDGVSVGVYLIPSDAEAGNLERLILATVAGTPLMEECRAFLTRVNDEHNRLPEPDKSLAMVYLACRPEDTRGVGRAFKDGVFNADHHCLSNLKAFLQTILD